MAAHHFVGFIILVTMFNNINGASFPNTCSFWRSQNYTFECTAWQTPEKECIYGGYECDSVLDCDDGSDEVNCQAEHAIQCIDDFINKPFGIFRCLDGMCIPDYTECDGIRDCVDYSDEARCIF